jgi:tetratricopeptide (TPR) repeat protein
VVADDRSLAELEEERDFLLRSLDDIERERGAGDLAEGDYATLKDDYTARTAAVLRAIEEARTRRPSDLTAPTADPPPRWRPQRPSPKAVLVALGLVAFAVVAGILAARAVGDRLPGQASTGAIAPTGPATDLARARQLVGQGKTLAAVQLYDQILAKDPRQVEALAYRGWLTRLVGREANNPALIDKGLGLINQAVAVDPSYPDARFFRGLVLYQDKGDPAAAIPDFRAYLASDPPQDTVALVQDVLNRALAETGQAPPAAPPAGQAPPATVPGAAPPPG